MKNKFTKTLLFILCVCLAASLVCLAACVVDDDTKVTVTVDFNLEGMDDVTLTIDKDAEFYNRLTELIPVKDGITFGGWFTDGGEAITSSSKASGDLKVTAKWLAVYSAEYYLETDNGYELSTEYSVNDFGELGATVNAAQKEIAGYDFDASNSSNVTSVTLTAGNNVLKLYYNRKTVTVTFDKNLEIATGSMSAISGKYGQVKTLASVGFIVPEDRYQFAGWNTQPDGRGKDYDDGATLTLEANVTLYAQWLTTYYEQVYVELLDGTFELNGKYLRTGILGTQVTVKSSAPETYYVLDEENANSLLEGTVSDDLVLKVYFRLATYKVTYRDDNTVATVKHGAEFVIRQPSDATVLSYCTSATGDGREYSFGTKLTVTSNITLYPVIVDIYTADDHSGDTVEIRRNFTGKGSAVLNKDGESYEGFVTINETTVVFDVTIRENEQDEGVYCQGKLNENGTFTYRNEDEVGTYFYFDYLFDEFYEFVMLSLDGYGLGVCAMPVNDDSGRIANYLVNYEKTKYGDYYMQYYLPAEPSKIYEDYFQIVKYSFDSFPEMDGYFMFYGYEENEYVLIYNWEAQETMLYLDGYGNATLYELDGNGNVVDVDGIYCASDDYTEDQPEYLFVINGDFENALIFTAFTIKDGDQTVGVFMIKRGEFGVYTQEEGVPYPELYLDGYGGAQYTSEEGTEEDDKARVGYYIILSDKNGGYVVEITFEDEAGGKMYVSLDTEKQLFINNQEGDFVIVDGVLIEYLGSSSIIEIPEGVTEIADYVFKDRNITTLTLPSTIQKIGLYAFQNSASSTNQSLLTTIYIKSETPPILVDDPESSVGPNPFRWLQENAKIFVPDGCEEAYLEAESWANYTGYITTRAIQNNKPLFEIKNGVLLSYNNKDENPENVSITIPDEVTEIAKGVFASYEYIVSVNLNNVTVIGDKAFYGCTNLASVTFNANTVSIGKEAFYQCTSLTEVDLGNVQTIGDGAFQRCFNLAKVHIGTQINQIGTLAFSMCSVEVSDDESMIVPHDLIVTIDATSAPTLATSVFIRSQPRIYVGSYEIGVAYAGNEAANWMAYASALRIKTDAETAVYYSKSNMGATLVLDDRADFDSGSYTGLYKLEGGYIYIAWLNYDSFTHSLTIIEQRASEVNGEIRGFSFGNEEYVFLHAGKQVAYERFNGDMLIVTAGSKQATFNGNEVTIDIVNFRMQFDYEGYTYKLALTIDETFDYTRVKIEVIKNYTAADGSTLSIRFGNLIEANGTLYGVLEAPNLMYSETWRWNLTEVEENVYTWTSDWRGTKYYITATLDGDTFTYESGVYSYNEYYRNDLGDMVIVTVTRGQVVSIHIQFKTANDSLEDAVEYTLETDGSYTVVVDIDIDGVPSEFNGTYKLILNKDTMSFTLTQLS